MLRMLGFTFVSSEAVTWAVMAILFVSVLAAWVVDSIMHDSAFGIIGNTLLIFAGSLAALVGWNLYVKPIVSTDVAMTILVCVGGGFGTVLFMAILRRILAR